jgi:sulfate transporter 4
VGATLLLLTPVFENMPLNALGAIVISGVIGLINCDEAVFLWRVSVSMGQLGIREEEVRTSM